MRFRVRLAVAGFAFAAAMGCPKAPDSSGDTSASSTSAATVPDANAKSSARIAELMDAAAKGQPSRVRALIESGANINDRDDAGETALMKSAEHGHLNLTYDLIANGARLNEKNNKGETALMKAADGGYLQLIEVLLAPREVLASVGLEPEKLAPVDKDPAAPDDADKAGRTAFMRAAAAGRLPVIKMLLKKEGVNKYRRDAAGNSALLLAIAGGHADVVRMITGSGYNDILSLTQADDQGRNLIMKAAAKGDVASLKTLLALNSENWFRNAQHDGKSFVDQKDKAGKTAAQLAEEGKHDDIAKLLKEHAAANAKDDSGKTPLMSAAAKGDESAIRELLDKGADVTARDAQGQTALMLAAGKGHADAVNAMLGSLIDGGTSASRMFPGKSGYIGTEPADYAKIKDGKGKTALQLAKDGKHESTLAVFKAYSIE